MVLKYSKATTTFILISLKLVQASNINNIREAMAVDVAIARDKVLIPCIPAINYISPGINYKIINRA